MKLLLKWVVGALSLWLTVLAGRQLGIKGLALDSAMGALVSILALTLVNAFIRPVVSLLAMPLNCLTLGLMRFVVNALMFWLVGSMNLGLTVRGFVPALFGSVVLSLVSGVLDQYLPEKIDRKG